MKLLNITQMSDNPEDGAVITYAPSNAPDSAEVERLLSVYHDGIGWFHRLLKRPGRCVWKWEV